MASYGLICSSDDNHFGVPDNYDTCYDDDDVNRRYNDSSDNRHEQQNGCNYDTDDDQSK